jgi:hypothetical protein
MGRYRVLELVLLATQLGILACGDGTGPRRIDGTYALRRVEGVVGPPFVVGDLSCAPGERIVHEITGDTIVLMSTGAARRIRVYQARVWSQGIEGEPLVGSTDGSASYRRDGNLVILTYPAFPQGPPAPVDTFRLSPMGFERESGLGGVCASGPTDLRRGKFEYARL